tara:strand:+ start:214 stop:348 length:135 start_codon:yes stop_codon:yes gene_type:complete
MMKKFLKEKHDHHMRKPFGYRAAMIWFVVVFGTIFFLLILESNT